MDVRVVVGEELGGGEGGVDAGVKGEEARGLAERLPGYRVAVDATLPCGCIDGRKCVHTLGGGETQPRAKIAGGALVTGLAAAELTSFFGDDTSSAEERLRHLDQLFVAQGITPGAHGDQANFGAQFAGGTGCGAGDKLPKILQTLEKNIAAVTNLRNGLLGEEQGAPEYQTVASMQPTLQTWRPQAVIDVTKDRSEDHVEILYSDESDTHGHKESLVVFNYTENTTIDRDRLVEETGKQVFVVDMWYLKKMANALATGPEATEQAAQLLRAMVDYQLATYLTLCNGTQRPVYMDKQENYALAT